MRGGRWAAMLVAGVVAACSTSSQSEVRASEVYGAAVEWLAAERSDDPEPLPVFVEPRGEGTSIKLEVQVEVVKAVAEVAVVRFIDARSEAIVDGEEGRPAVRDGGILLRLGPVVEDGDRIRLEVDRWITDERFSTLEFVLRRTGDEWLVSGDPVVTGMVDLHG